MLALVIMGVAAAYAGIAAVVSGILDASETECEHLVVMINVDALRERIRAQREDENLHTPIDIDRAISIAVGELVAAFNAEIKKLRAELTCPCWPCSNGDGEIHRNDCGYDPDA